MMDSVSHLLRAEGDMILASDREAVLEAIQRMTPVHGPRNARSGPFPHPWRTKVAPDDDGVPGRWRVTMRTGWVNDVEASVAYLEVNDPRGWQKPEKYPASRVANGVVERSWREQEDPPYLVINTDKDFLPVPDSARHPAFKTADAWEKELLVARAFLYARPMGLVQTRPVTPRYRTWAGKMPAKNADAVNGVWELARIFVLKGNDPEDQEAFVEQVEFWPLFAQGIEPVRFLPGYGDIPDLFGTIGLGFAGGALAAYNAANAALMQIVNGGLLGIQSNVDTVEFWN